MSVHRMDSMGDGSPLRCTREELAELLVRMGFTRQELGMDVEIAGRRFRLGATYMPGTPGIGRKSGGLTLDKYDPQRGRVLVRQRENGKPRYYTADYWVRWAGSEMGL